MGKPKVVVLDKAQIAKEFDSHFNTLSEVLSPKVTEDIILSQLNQLEKKLLKEELPVDKLQAKKLQINYVLPYQTKLSELKEKLQANYTQLYEAGENPNESFKQLIAQLQGMRKELVEGDPATKKKSVLEQLKSKGVRSTESDLQIDIEVAASLKEVPLNLDGFDRAHNYLYTLNKGYLNAFGNILFTFRNNIKEAFVTSKLLPDYPKFELPDFLMPLEKNHSEMVSTTYHKAVEVYKTVFSLGNRSKAKVAEMMLKFKIYDDPFNDQPFKKHIEKVKPKLPYVYFDTVNNTSPLAAGWLHLLKDVLETQKSKIKSEEDETNTDYAIQRKKMLSNTTLNLLTNVKPGITAFNILEAVNKYTTLVNSFSDLNIDGNASKPLEENLVVYPGETITRDMANEVISTPYSELNKPALRLQKKINGIVSSESTFSGSIEIALKETLMNVLTSLFQKSTDSFLLNLNEKVEPLTYQEELELEAQKDAKKLKEIKELELEAQKLNDKLNKLISGLVAEEVSKNEEIQKWIKDVVDNQFDITATFTKFQPKNVDQKTNNKLGDMIKPIKTKIAMETLSSLYNFLLDNKSEINSIWKTQTKGKDESPYIIIAKKIKSMKVPKDLIKPTLTEQDIRMQSFFALLSTELLGQEDNKALFTKLFEGDVGIFFDIISDKIDTQQLLEQAEVKPNQQTNQLIYTIPSSEQLTQEVVEQETVPQVVTQPPLKQPPKAPAQQETVDWATGDQFQLINKLENLAKPETIDAAAEGVIALLKKKVTGSTIITAVADILQDSNFLAKVKEIAERENVVLPPKLGGSAQFPPQVPPQDLSQKPNLPQKIVPLENLQSVPKPLKIGNPPPGINVKTTTSQQVAAAPPTAAGAQLQTWKDKADGLLRRIIEGDNIRTGKIKLTNITSGTIRTLAGLLTESKALTLDDEANGYIRRFRELIDSLQEDKDPNRKELRDLLQKNITPLLTGAKGISQQSGKPLSPPVKQPKSKEQLLQELAETIQLLKDPSARAEEVFNSVSQTVLELIKNTDITSNDLAFPLTPFCTIENRRKALYDFLRKNNIPDTRLPQILKGKSSLIGALDSLFE